ncbi:MAG: cytochrome c oxidase subunit 3 family protein [Bacteroidales bacterium]|nr:cytochrome c oxidase subunit 3 family protein [Bacteroidales bacterium]
MSTVAVHRDDVGSKIGMWLFIFTELLLFGGLFIVYAVYRYKNPVAFHLAGEELDVTVGTLNTVILLISSATVAMSISAVQYGNKRATLSYLLITILLALFFMINKYFEWSGKFGHGMYPGSEKLTELGQGEVLFFGLYFAMTGLHALHIIIGVTILLIMLVRIMNNKINKTYFVQLENSGLYWHLVDIIWIFLFPLFYLIS